jgi:soluble lytic murein transglycosylase-like protein
MFPSLFFLCCCAIFLATSGVARAQMTIRDVPLNRTAAWEKHAAMLREKRSPETVPPLRVGTSAATAVTTPQGALPATGVPGEWLVRISHASRRHGVDEALLAAVLTAESNFNPYAVSPKGARGAMQIMPATGKELGLRDFFDPEANLDAGANYLAALLREFPDAKLALAAYNAGPAAVRRHGGIPPYEETRNYVARVLALFSRYGGRLR